MALTNTSEYQVFLNQLLWHFETYYPGVDVGYLNQAGNPALGSLLNQLVRDGMIKADVTTVMNAYLTYKKTRQAKPTNSEVNPSSHGSVNTSTFSNGNL